MKMALPASEPHQQRKLVPNQGKTRRFDKLNRKMSKLLVYLILLLFSLVFIVPFLWLISGSLKSSTELFADPPIWIPEVLNWSNYKEAFSSFPFLLYLKNTLIVVVFSCVGAVLSNAFIAYGFSRIEWKYRDAVFIVVLATLMLPFQVIMIPLFLLFKDIGWIGTYLPLIVPHFFGNAFFIFLLRQFFKGIPKELSEAAKMDGANEFIVFWKVILPLSKPILATVVIFQFIEAWRDFLGPLIFLSDNSHYTLSLGVQQIMSQNDPRWGLLMAIGVAMTLPIIIIFFFLQRYFIEGITFTGSKG
ncbi:carbohydrate ABC transporter permease [Metabacillus malikii]|uniref:ABC-type glycerol-3-phosphate transport system permease component n=1 Tax=Metabacillus malikii TaxID=1504265 RepID=A0ABT9ZAF4_9BACI|nr:carbohydrate ABC transporter permease [Metabacillus malikii]MDQ0229005.1 ABC-type glycerol-3-phosphate transport system permease component [Metabacillus malikii]